MFRDMTENRDGGHAFDTLYVSRRIDTLHITVSGPGDTRAYRFVWDGLIQESFPMGIRLVLTVDDIRGRTVPDSVLVIPLNVRKIIGTANAGTPTMRGITGFRSSTAQNTKRSPCPQRDGNLDIQVNHVCERSRLFHRSPWMGSYKAWAHRRRITAAASASAAGPGHTATRSVRPWSGKNWTSPPTTCWAAIPSRSGNLIGRIMRTTGPTSIPAKNMCCQIRAGNPIGRTLRSSVPWMTSAA
ncbi:protein of unknown function [Methylocaldum szegediense]|uniref:Uncharacterized protein n=1 Tax=Methylocaldum szegediense TaxID=73780 RepID=A0ABM9HW66_9GAMM|nr:protein of unknown function [Methylocaldum szegediense]